MRELQDMPSASTYKVLSTLAWWFATPEPPNHQSKHPTWSVHMRAPDSNSYPSTQVSASLLLAGERSVKAGSTRVKGMDPVGIHVSAFHGYGSRKSSRMRALLPCCVVDSRCSIFFDWVRVQTRDPFLGPLFRDNVCSQGI